MSDSIADLGSVTTRLALDVFGSTKDHELPMRVRALWTLIFPLSMSDHLSPRASPGRRPVVRSRTHNASHLVPFDAARNVVASLAKKSAPEGHKAF